MNVAIIIFYSILGIWQTINFFRFFQSMTRENADDVENAKLSLLWPMAIFILCYFGSLFIVGFIENPKSVGILIIFKRLKLDDKGILVTEDGSAFILPVGESISGTAELPELPAGELHTDRVEIDGIGVKSKTHVHDHDDWNGETPKPSIDIEKADHALPAAGAGNHTDKANNLGEYDRDTKETAKEIKAEESTSIFFRGTNNGTENLTHIKVEDHTENGSVDVKGIIWSYNGQTLKINDAGELTTQDDKLLLLKVGESITGEGELGALPAGELHSDKVSISGEGELDNVGVSDDDEWYGKVTPKPSIDTEKANDSLPKAGNGNHSDKANNIGNNDHDTKESLYVVKDSATTAMWFSITNNGNEPLTKIKAEDILVDGKVAVEKIVWTYKKTTITKDKSGYFVTQDGKYLILQPGESLSASGILPVLPAGELHSNTINVTAEGVYSHEPVGDDDKWFGKVTPNPSIDVEKANGGVPDAGQGNGKDKENNIGDNDHDTKETAAKLKAQNTTDIDFKFTNNGNETLIDLKPIDKTIEGNINIEELSYTYKNKEVKLDKEGYFTLDDKRLELAPGEAVIGHGTLPGMTAGSSHGDEMSISAKGKTSQTGVEDKDNWYGITPAATVTPKKSAFLNLPTTGDGAGKLALWAGVAVIIGSLSIAGIRAYRVKKGKLEELDLD